MADREKMAMDYLLKLYDGAQRYDFNHGVEFDSSKYQWTLGVCVMNDIANELVFHNSKDEPMSLFGIPVLRDYHNPDNVQLWKNITSEL